MLKALLKKELSQFLSFYTFDPRKGKARSKGAVVGLAVLIGFGFLSFVMMFFSMAEIIIGPILESGRSWLFFALEGCLTVFMGLIGSAFSTYSTIYRAQDNELLLAMPIPPAKILFARMVKVYLTNLLSCALVWLPAVAAYSVSVGLVAPETGFSLPTLVIQLLMLLVISGLVTVLTSVLGWLIGLVSRRLRSKTFITVLFSLIFILGYIYLYSRISALLKLLIANLDRVEAFMRGWGRPIMLFGLGAAGELLPFLGFTLVTAALFALMYFILSRTLLRILTAGNAAKKAVYREKKARQAGVGAALLGRELKRFISIPIVLMNTGFGILVMVIGTVFIFIRTDSLREKLYSVLSPMGMDALAPIVAVLAVVIFLSLDCLTSSSVSLEGKQIWVLQSMPVSAKLIMRSKVRAQVVLNAVPAIFAEAAFARVIRASFPETMCMMLCAVLFVWLTAEFGLMMNLKRPNLEWTSEAVPVKQGLPVLFTMLFGWGCLLAFTAFGAVLIRIMPSAAALLIFSVTEVGFSLLMKRWNDTRGAGIFAHLS